MNALKIPNILIGFFVMSNAISVYAAKFGDIIGDLNGVQIYSNGSPDYVSNARSSYGMKWQCVEFVNRYYANWMGMPNWTGTGDAHTYWDKYVEKGLVRYENGGSTPPEVNDILVWNTTQGGGYGHVAIVSAITDTSVDIMEQNWNQNNGTRTISRTGNTLNSTGLYGWMRPSTKFDGAGSLARPNESCWGCNKDEAKMHPHQGHTSTVVFQWRYNVNTCEHVDIATIPDIGTVSVQARYWLQHLTQTGFASTLPTSVTTQGGEWNIFSVTSTKPLTSDVSVYAYCRNSSSPKVGNKTTFTTQNLVGFDESYFWSGNGSIISLSNESGYGGTKDEAVTFDGVGHNSLTVFQWYMKNSCPRLELKSADTYSSFSVNGVSVKSWDALDFGSNLCSQLPCTINAPGGAGYYLVKIKSSSGIVPGGKLSAACTN